MTKPIEWTTPAKTVTVPGDTLRLDVRYPIWEDGERMGHSWRDATPSDLVAALAAMGQKEAEQVIRDAGAAGSFDMQSAIIADLRNKLAAAEGCAEACRAETRRADAAWAAEERLHKEATARAEKAERERDEFRTATAVRDEQLALVRSQREKAERERDEARKELADVKIRDANGWGVSRCLLNAAEGELTVDAARRVVAERDSLRARLIAAETAAAQREPREYPLAEGSKWSGDSIVGSAGYELHTVTSDRFLVCYPGRSASAPFADVLALAHRRGLL